MALLSDITKAFKHPDKLKRYVGVLSRSIPFRLRLTKLLPRSYHLSYAPERYVTHYAKYRSQTTHQMYDPAAHHKWLAGNYANNAGDMTRYYFLNLACDQIIKEGIRGDIAEIGVYKGNSAYSLAKLARHLGTTAYLFDTFDSFDSRDLVGMDEAVSKDAFNDTSIENVNKIVGEDNVRYIQGYFPESLDQIGHASNLRFCLVHIDCDLYVPFKAALEYFYPRLNEGGLLIMHDYSGYVWEGVEKAVDEFFRDKPERPIPIPDKSGTAVIRKSFDIKRVDL
jgi:hypothetical protein